MVNKINKLNVFIIKYYYQQKKRHSIETFTNKTHVHNYKTRALFKKKNKEFKTIYLACISIFEFQKFDETLRYPYLSILNIKNEKKKTERN